MDSVLQFGDKKCTNKWCLVNCSEPDSTNDEPIDDGEVGL